MTDHFPIFAIALAIGLASCAGSSPPVGPASPADYTAFGTPTRERLLARRGREPRHPGKFLLRIDPQLFDQLVDHLSRHLLGGTVSNVELVAGVSLQTAGTVNFDAEISADGNTLWFVDSHFTNGSPDSADIVIADRSGDGFVRRADSAAVLQAVNTAALEYAPCISVDGLELFFTRLEVSQSRATPAIYTTTRSSVNDAFARRSAWPRHRGSWKDRRCRPTAILFTTTPRKTEHSSSIVSRADDG